MNSPKKFHTVTFKFLDAEDHESFFERFETLVQWCLINIKHPWAVTIHDSPELSSVLPDGNGYVEFDFIQPEDAVWFNLVWR